MSPDHNDNISKKTRNCKLNFKENCTAQVKGTQHYTNISAYGSVNNTFLCYLLFSLLDYLANQLPFLPYEIETEI